MKQPFICATFLATLLLQSVAGAQQSEQAVACDEGVIPEPVGIAYGDSTLNCVVDSATDRDRFSLVGAAGTDLRVLVLSQTNFLDPRLEIRDNVGTVIFDQFCNGQNQFGQGIQCSFATNLTLPVDGTYDLAISDSGTNESGAYLMQVESIPPMFMPPLIAYDDSQFDTVSPGTDTDFFRFYAAPGTEVRVNMLSRSNFYDPRLEIRAPDGAVIWDEACSGQNQFGQGIQCSFSATFTPPLTGDYLIAISDSASNESGNYEFSVFCIFGPCNSDGVGNADPPPPVIAYDEAVVETIATRTDGSFRSFFVTAGTSIRLNVYSTANFFDPAVEIRDATGALVASEACSGQNQFGQGVRCSFSLLFDITLSEMYTLVLYDSATNESGGAEMSLFCLSGSCDSDGAGDPDPDPPQVTYVSTNEATVGSATDGAFYRFYGIQGADVRIDNFSSANFFDPVVQIRDPGGAVLQSGSCSGQNQFGQGIRCSFSLNMVLPDTGWYDIAVFDSGTNEAGGLAFTVHCFRGDCDSDADGLLDPQPEGIDYGSNRTAPIAPATDLDFNAVQGTAGDDIQISVVSQTNFFDPVLEVYGPDGTLVSSSSCNGQNQFGQGIMCSFALNLNSLPETGIYRLAVYDSGVNETGAYLLGLQCVFGTCANPPPPSDVGDNCIEFANGPAIPDAGGNVQRDTNGDGIGNHCDADLNDDCVVNPQDLGLFRAVFFTADPEADFNGDGIVNPIDLGVIRRLFFADFTVDSPSGIPDLCD